MNISAAGLQSCQTPAKYTGGEQIRARGKQIPRARNDNLGSFRPEVTFDFELQAYILTDYDSTYVFVLA